jgi:short subunit dehydrogenase-like uncharacterized protein
MSDYDVVVFGATGFTGRLVAEYLLETYAADGALRWAMAGRNEAKLREVAAGLGAEAVPVLLADSGDPASLERLAEQTRVVCSTVGPYALYGSDLVAACAGSGTHYCDLTGEVQWMRRMIDAHSDAAESSGARIVHNCGFDCIPSDLGTLFLQNAMLARYGVPAAHIRLRVNAFAGAFSGGTVASLMNVMEEAVGDRKLRRLLTDPYSLNPNRNPDAAPTGPDRDDQRGAIYDPDFGRWTLPFIMAAINTRVVRRSNALMGFPYGEQFRYEEAMLAPRFMGPLSARLAAGAMMAGALSMAVPPVRAVARRLLPSPGEGPDREQRERGYFDIYLYGEHPEDRELDLIARVQGDRDPGYGSTSKMLAEAAVCLAQDELDCGGGFWTPAAAMGQRLIERLESRAGVSFSLETGLP